MIGEAGDDVAKAWPLLFTVGLAALANGRVVLAAR